MDHYLALENKPITRAIAEQRMLEKLARSLTEDINPLLPAGVQFAEADAINAFERVWIELIEQIGGEPWKLTEPALEELRVKISGAAFAIENNLTVKKSTKTFRGTIG